MMVHGIRGATVARRRTPAATVATGGGIRVGAFVVGEAVGAVDEEVVEGFAGLRAADL